ncbi:alpha/beta hydrolase family protein [Sphingobacterium sp. SYP-B4668]|uniref:alpha/beta hydrolase family protein n=1 Tax=Sphingobacterium sp. SYP-B4668 TaxID=2996035 RepID=UPI0022DDC5A7|nr:alpha/beta hydrolase [Sphingobacterium sp. SYP-B4668]
MKYLYAIFLLSILNVACGQSITGTWKGELQTPGQRIPLVFHIHQDNEGYAGTMDSPKQGAIGLPLSEVKLNGDVLKLKMSTAGLEYEGRVASDTIKGEFRQGGGTFNLSLTKTLDSITIIKRPQEPEGVPNYREVEVSFFNKKADLTLAGTLTMPATGKGFPAILLVTGSGPQNRDEELFGHKPFKLIADYLTKNGYAVLRYDDRGVGESTGDFSLGTTADFAADAAAGVAFLTGHPAINPAKIGVIGHSEGGMIAPMLAAEDSKIAFIGLLAGPTIAIDSLMLLQNAAFGKASGMSEDALMKARDLNRKIYAIVKSSRSDGEVKKTLMGILNNSKQVDELTSPWFRSFFRFEPGVYLNRVNCPIFAVYGGKDLQVPAEANLNAIYRISEKKKNRLDFIKVYPDLNHLFQHAQTGLVNEYGFLEETMSEEVLRDLKTWLDRVTL